MSALVRCAVGVSDTDAGADSFAEAASRAALGLGGAAADVAIVFAGAPNLAHAGEGMAAVADRLRPAAAIGCGAQGVVGEAREIEQGGVAVWAAALGDGAAAFALEASAGEAGSLAIRGMPDLDRADALVLLVDPFSFPVEPLLATIAQGHPGLPVIGGLASARSDAGSLLGRDGPVGAGAVGLSLSGVRVAPCVSQGARPVGPEMAITAGEGNVIQELAGKPAVARLQEAVAMLSGAERELAVQGLLLGLVVDPNKPEYERGDFLVRGILSADAASGAVTVGERIRVGQAVRLQVRDADSAHEDLAAALERGCAELGGPPAGALLFTCNGRGSHMFSTPDHDAQVLDGATGAPAAGFFCAGEIGPVGDRNFVHGFTATMALIAPVME